jgi:hypothetical protein
MILNDKSGKCGKTRTVSVRTVYTWFTITIGRRDGFSEAITFGNRQEGRHPADKIIDSGLL